MKLIGDTHFGKKFKTGVPLNRRGELEEMFFAKFEKELNFDDRFVVQMGDLFDSVIVDLNTIDRVYNIIRNAYNNRKTTDFFFIRGNHDAPRDSAQVSAFDILEKMCAPMKDRVYFVVEPMRYNNNVLVGWNYFRQETLREIFDRLQLSAKDSVFGHFEEPIEPVLLEIGNPVFSGHIHKAHTVGNVSFVGSLLPLAFGEEGDSSIMETVSLDDLLSRDPEEIKNKRLRVLLKEGEELPDNIDCLQLIAKKSDITEVVLDNEIEEVDMRKLFMEELGPSGLAEEIFARYNDKLHQD